MENKTVPVLFSYDDSGQQRARDLTYRQLHDTRPMVSCGVWHFEDKAWKIFSSDENYSKLKSVYDQAVANNVPTPDFKFIKGSVAVKDDCGPPRKGFALVSTYVQGHFFTLEKSPCILGQTIDSIASVDVLSRIEQGLAAAVNIGLRDPQGFINPTNDKPIMFIDLHTDTTTSRALIDMHKKASTRLVHLQSPTLLRELLYKQDDQTMSA